MLPQEGRYPLLRTIALVHIQLAQLLCFGANVSVWDDSVYGAAARKQEGCLHSPSLLLYSCEEDRRHYHWWDVG